MIYVDKINAVLALGINNFLRVLWYKFCIKIKVHPVLMLKSTVVEGDVFRYYDGNPKNYKLNSMWLNSHLFFSYQSIRANGIPDWHKSCLTYQTVKETTRPWYDISDFDEKLGDIKGVWEASRFDWVLSFSQSAAAGHCED